MDNYGNQRPLDKLMQEKIKLLPDEALDKHLAQDHTNSTLIYLLIEANRRKDTVIQDLNRRITRLEEKTLTKPGRKRQTYLYEGEELTDEKLVYLIDYEFYDSIGKLEKIVGTKKNVLRNRYKKTKNKQKIERDLENYGDC